MNNKTKGIFQNIEQTYTETETLRELARQEYGSGGRTASEDTQKDRRARQEEGSALKKGGGDCTRPVPKVPSHIKWKREAFIEEDTRNIVHRTMTPQSPSKQAPWDLTQVSHSTPAAPLYFPESHEQAEISSLSSGF